MSDAKRVVREQALVAWPHAAVLALAFFALWTPYASLEMRALAALSSVAGAIAGSITAGSRLRSWVVVATGLVVLGATGLLSRVLGAWSLPAAVLGPETASAIVDAGAIAAASMIAALVVTHAARRVPGGGILPASLLVLAVAALLLPHRGGSINRPLEVGDLAWLRGWHPAFVLGFAGALAGLVATFALVRPARAGRILATIAAASLVAALLLATYPAFGVFGFSDVDPLWLGGAPGDERGFLPGRGGPKPAGAREGPRNGDALGLLRPGGGGSGSGEAAPFLDDYPTDGAQVPVAIVVLRDDVEPANGIFYFRQVAFSQWNGRRLVRSYESGVDDDVFTVYPASGAILREPPPATARRVPLEATISLLREHAQPFAITDAIALEPEENVDPSLFRRSYRARSLVLVEPPDRLFGDTAGSAAWPDGVRAIYGEVPQDPRYRALAEEILETLRPEYRDDPWARALSVGLWLQENTQYSVRSKHADAPDPTASYLFGSRIGYCVHLAHAGVYLMRALGLPARVSAGYAYEASARGSGSAVLLRSGDAHAWAEVHLAGAGWVPIDPSPPSIDPPLAAPDMDLQSLLGELARGDASRLARDMPSAWRLPTWRELALAALITLVLWALSGHAIKAWRRYAPRVAGRDPAARLAYRAALDRLADAGITREHGETREAFARRAASVAPSFTALTALHLGARWGGHEAPLDQARAHLDRVHEEIRRALSAARSTRVSLLAPWRWMRSR